jgi:hypothetical protein
MQDVNMILNPVLPWKQQYQQEGNSFYLQIGLKFNEGTNKRLR